MKLIEEGTKTEMNMFRLIEWKGNILLLTFPISLSLLEEMKGRNRDYKIEISHEEIEQIIKEKEDHIYGMGV